MNSAPASALAQSLVGPLREILQRKAKAGKLITYEHAGQLLSTPGRLVLGRDVHLWSALGLLIDEDTAAGRPLLSSLVYNDKENAPGLGYFKRARLCGHIIRDEAKFWNEQVTAVFLYYAKPLGGENGEGKGAGKEDSKKVTSKIDVAAQDRDHR